MDFVKVLKINQSNVKKGKVTNIQQVNIVKLSSYNFLIKALEQYNNRKFENDEMVTEFFKLMLPINEEKAREQWFNGVEYDGHIYKAWFATTGGMKHESNNSKCETIFIRDDYIDFAETVEDLVSLKKFKDLEQLSDNDENKTFCINKDVLSRLSLITSDLIGEIEMPNFIVLSQPSYRIVKDCKTVRKSRYTDKEGKQVVDYRLEDYNRNENVDRFDGGGIATPKVFQSIQQTMKVDYDIEFSIIRAYGLGIKGLITKFNIIEYLEENYNGKTDYCRINEKGQFELLDRWGYWQVVTDNTILLNDSMVKLAKHFNGAEEYHTRLNNVKPKYKRLLNKLYITKINKSNSKIDDYRRTNYQLINGLALTYDDYYKLAEQDIKVFNKIIKPFDYDEISENFITNVDYIHLFYKNIINEEISENDQDFEEKVYRQCENIVDKVHELISIDKNFVKLDLVKKNLRSLVEKKVRDLALGKVTVKAKCQYIAIDPISYMNFAMYRNQGEDGLLEDQFYSADCENEDVRTIQRNPTAAYSEIHNIQFVRNEYLDKWLSNCRELIYLNQKDDIYDLLSGADSDGDFLTVIDNVIIRNAVVTPKDGKYYLNTEDGDTENLLYSKENRFIGTYRASGNLIGKIALKAASINSNAQMIPEYYDIENEKLVRRKELLGSYLLENEGETSEDFREYMKQQLEEGKYKYSNDMKDEVKRYIKEQFYKNEKDIYIILFNSMKAIDSVKTLKFPDNVDMAEIEKKYRRKPYFLQYKERKEDVIKNQYGWTNSAVDKLASKIQEYLIEIIENSKKKFRDRSDILQKAMRNEYRQSSVIDDVFKEVNQLYEKYNQERKEAEKECRLANKKLYEEKDYFMGEVGNWDEWKEETLLLKKKENKKIRI